MGLKYDFRDMIEKFKKNHFEQMNKANTKIVLQKMFLSFVYFDVRSKRTASYMIVCHNLTLV